MFRLQEISAAIIAAPMAGGPSTPALSAAVGDAGGLGYLAGGLLTVAALADQIGEARSLGFGPLAVNLFVPEASTTDPEALADYAERLAPLAEHYGVSLEIPSSSRNHTHYEQQVELLLEIRPELVSFTFGCPSPAVLSRFAARGVTTSVTVTSVAEAQRAVAQGAATLTVQGPDAGGHIGCFDPAALPSTLPLLELIAAVRETTGVPLIAAGGLSSAAAVSAVLAAGAEAAQLGTAFLLAHEAGTSPLHRAALCSEAFSETSLTRAFTGRRARGLRNDFMAAYDPFAPAGYPEIRHLTAPLVAAAKDAGEPQHVNLWAGTGFRLAREASAESILDGLRPEARR